MKSALLYSLLALSDASKNKQPKKPKKKPKANISECQSNGLNVIVDGPHTQKCKGTKCQIRCAAGTALVGAKKIECRRDQNNQLYLHPAETPKCTTCDPLESLIDFSDYIVHTKKRKKGNLYTMSCKNQKNILPFNKFYLAAQCFCDKKKGECYWQGQGKINIQAQIDQMRCETNKKEEVTDSEMSSLISRPARITPGLTCDNKDRIVGGVEAVQHSWPWIVQLKYGANTQGRSGHTCSGTIVDENLIVTAAHCCAAFNDMEKLAGVVAEHSVINHIDNAYRITFKRKIIHPSYRSWTLENDICLLIPNEPLNLHGRVEQTKTARACLPQQGEANPPSSTLCWTAGWGRLSFKGQLANVLNEVDVKLVDDQTCQNSNTGSILHLDSQKCAGHLEGGKDACQGDSGGPLICAENGQPILRGIVSGGIGCALPNNAGIYTRIENYIEWIKFYVENDVKTIRAHKNALLNQRSNQLLTNREARRLQFKLITEGKVKLDNID